MFERYFRQPLPEAMYEGGFANSSGAVKLALEHAGITPPAVLYYPGSATDVSLIGIEGLRVIHADRALNEQMLGGFALLDAEAHAVDVHEWQPDRQVDAIAFINSTGIDEARVVERTDLRGGGLVLWAAWWRGGPESLKDLAALSLIGILDYAADNDNYVMDTDDLDAYVSGDKTGFFYVFQKGRGHTPAGLPDR